jgi:branched-chain amino acid transport system ATP-binding protein
MLKVKGLEVYYGHIHALKGINFEVEEGEIVLLLGANGAGKTTTLKAITGLVPVARGGVEFQEKDLSTLSTHEIVREGITYVPEGRGIFENLTVIENLELGGYPLKNRREGLEHVFEVFPILQERMNQLAATLSGGEQQMLAIGRGLMAKPRLLLLDEPSLGLAPMLTRRIFSTIQKIRDEGTTILLVEQNASMALKISDRAYILETGEIVAYGKSSELIEDEALKQAYLGR